MRVVWIILNLATGILLAWVFLMTLCVNRLVPLIDLQYNREWSDGIWAAKSFLLPKVLILTVLGLVTLIGNLYWLRKK